MLHGILRFDGHPSVMMGFLRNIEGIGPHIRITLLLGMGYVMVLIEPWIWVEHCGSSVGNGSGSDRWVGTGVTKIVLLELKSVPLTSRSCRYARMHIQQRLVRDLPCNTECRGDHCRSHMR
ncbi:hypothetical protein Tco_0261370 [Tanacetum coccineum]